MQVDCIVVAMNGDLQEQAVRVARVLRGKGQSVDLVLQKKKMKQVFKVGFETSRKRFCGKNRSAICLEVRTKER